MIRSGCQDLHFADPVVEAAGGFPQSGLGIDLSVSSKVDQGEQDIPKFPGKSGALGSGLGKFTKFLPDLGRNTLLGVGPIETGPGCPPLEVLGVEQGGEAAGHSIQAAFARGFFLLFELVPAPENLGRVMQLFPAKHMGVPADEFLRQFLGDLLEIKGLSLPSELGVKKNMEKNIPQLLFERMVVSLINGFEQLIDLLQNHWPEGAVRLLPIPRATTGASQPGHDPGQRLSFAHSPPLRGLRRFVEPERDEFG